MGLCSGLIQVWWAEVRKDHDAISKIRDATPLMVRDVLLSQIRSIYTSDPPVCDRALTGEELELLNFKYGDTSVGGIGSLLSFFSVKTEFELDLVLQHETPVTDIIDCRQFSPDRVSALLYGPGTCLVLLIFRSAESGPEVRRKGHRCALMRSAGGACRFYDPRIGEIRFSSISDFTEWLSDYWIVSTSGPLRRHKAAEPPAIRLVRFEGALTPEAAKKVALLWEQTREYARRTAREPIPSSGEFPNSIFALIYHCEQTFARLLDSDRRSRMLEGRSLNVPHVGTGSTL
jgi:hypothetical protein